MAWRSGGFVESGGDDISPRDAPSTSEAITQREEIKKRRQGRCGAGLQRRGAAAVNKLFTVTSHVDRPIWHHVFGAKSVSHN